MQTYRVAELGDIVRSCTHAAELVWAEEKGEEEDSKEEGGEDKSGEEAEGRPENGRKADLETR